MLLEKLNLKSAFLPKDLNGAATVAERISLEKAEKVTVVLTLGTSLTGADVVVSLKQHNLASGGTTAVLSVDNPYFKKVGAATKFTKVDPVAKADTFNLSTDFDTASGVLAFEVKASDLTEGNKFFSIQLADATVAKLATAIYIVSEESFKPSFAQDI